MTGPDINVLIALHVAALASYDAEPEAEWANQTEASKVISRNVDDTRAALLQHRPASMAEARLKGEFMASCRTFHDWDDFDRIELIRALTPEPEPTAIMALFQQQPK